jgi:hypothetical protein
MVSLEFTDDVDDSLSGELQAVKADKPDATKKSKIDVFMIDI